jgi:hypothetical protein
MTENIKSKTLAMALSAAGLQDLPKRWDGSDDKEYWIKAICLVKKRDMTEAYVVSKRTGDGKIIDTKIFGSNCQIVSLMGVYPYETLDEKQFCTFSSDRALKEALTKAFGEIEADDIMALDENDHKRKERIRDLGILLQEEKIKRGLFKHSDQEEAEEKEKEALIKQENDALDAADTVAKLSSGLNIPMQVKDSNPSNKAKVRKAKPKKAK